MDPIAIHKSFQICLDKCSDLMAEMERLQTLMNVAKKKHKNRTVRIHIGNQIYELGKRDMDELLETEGRPTLIIPKD